MAEIEIYDTDPWWDEPMGTRQLEGNVGFAPMQLSDYFAKANAEFEAFETDRAAHWPPAGATPDNADAVGHWYGEWVAFLLSPVASPTLQPPAGWRAFKHNWDTLDTYLLYSDEDVMALIEAYERSFVKLRARWVDYGGVVTAPAPVVGPPESKYELPPATEIVDKLFAVGLLAAGGYFLSQILTMRRRTA